MAELKAELKAEPCVEPKVRPASGMKHLLVYRFIMQYIFPNCAYQNRRNDSHDLLH